MGIKLGKHSIYWSQHPSKHETRISPHEKSRNANSCFAVLSNNNSRKVGMGQHHERNFIDNKSTLDPQDYERCFLRLINLEFLTKFEITFLTRSVMLSCFAP